MSDVFVSHTLEYPYRRTLGPVLGTFLTGLRDGRILGIRCGGRVLCPPLEFDPETGRTLEPDWVEVGPGGTLLHSTWVAEPTASHPFREPFAFALIRLDGADTALVHAVRARDPQTLRPGTRVRACFREERVGAITDLFFAPEAEAPQPVAVRAGEEPVRETVHHISLTYREKLEPARLRYARGLLEGKFIGQRSPATGKVFIPGKGYDPIGHVRLTEADDVELPPTGTVVSFTVVTPIRYRGQKETRPYISANILLDGADQPLVQQEIRTIPVEEFRIGMRVRAVFRPPAERSIEGIDNHWAFCGTGRTIASWEPTGEPDVPVEEFREHTL